jgi:single-strand DNA-binding protein
MNFNKVVLMGRLTRDVQISFTPNQTAVGEFGLATNRKWKGQDGHENEEVLYVDCVMFGKRAEVLNRYIGKGDPLFIEGRLKLDQWTTQDGLNRSKIRVIVENFEFISTKEAEPRATEPTQAEKKSIEEDDMPF